MTFLFTLLPVGQRLQEGDNSLLLRGCQTEIAHLAGHIGRILGCGPAGSGYVAGVVKVDDVHKALEVAIVPISLHEAGVRSLVNIAKCRYLEFSEFRFINRCDEAGALQIPTESHINPGCTQRIEREFRIERVFWVFRHTDVEVCEVGEQHLATGRIGGTRMAVGALCLAIEQRESQCLLRVVNPLPVPKYVSNLELYGLTSSDRSYSAIERPIIWYAFSVSSKACVPHTCMNRFA
jgi:hypothetical protein